MSNLNESNVMAGLSRRGFLGLAGAAGVAALAGAAFGMGGAGASQAHAAEAAAGTQVVTDMGGTQVTVPVEPKTYADGWYAHNEVSIMLTNAEGIVATHCDPKSYKWMYKVCPNMKKATVTFGKDFNYEDLVQLAPQVVFDSTDNLRDKLTSVNIPLVNCMFKTFEEMEQSITLTAQVFGGQAVDIAAKYNAELEKTLADIKAVTDPIAEADRPKVLHGNSVYTFTLDGTGTIIDDWISVAGGVNANPEDTTGNAQATFSLEQVIAWNPDVIITGKADEVDQILNDPNWASIAAVQNKAVYVNPKGVFGWDRYGVEELLQIQWAAARLHPELFPELKIEQKVKDFYKTYLRYDLTDDDVQRILHAQDPAEEGEPAASDAADEKAGAAEGKGAASAKGDTAKPVASGAGDKGAAAASGKSDAAGAGKAPAASDKGDAAGEGAASGKGEAAAGKADSAKAEK